MTHILSIYLLELFKNSMKSWINVSIFNATLSYISGCFDIVYIPDGFFFSLQHNTCKYSKYNCSGEHLTVADDNIFPLR